MPTGTDILDLVIVIGLAIAFIGAVGVVVRIAKRERKQKPIESNILVDPKMVPDLMHRWNTWRFMLTALKVAQDALGAMGTNLEGLAKTEGLEVIQEAIKQAESREGE